MSSTVTPRRLFAARPRAPALVDVAIALAALIGSMALITHGGVGPSSPGAAELDLVGVALAACSTLPLVVSRRFPLGVFALTAAASVLLAGLGYRFDLPLGAAAGLYSLAASRGEASPWTLGTAATVVVLFGGYLSAAAVAQGIVPGSEFLHTGLAWTVAWFAGERTRLRREQIAELSGRVVRAEREAERERLLAVGEERARIARDLHDSAGNAINVIAVRAGAARLRHGQDPDRSLLALEAIEQLAQQTAEEIDHIVGALREGGSGPGVVALPAGLASLDTLIARHRESGLDVTIDASGVARALGGPVDQAAYRVLQEALTNAARHGAGSARIALAFGHDSVELTVTNPLPAHVSPPPSGGHGLIGMRERATLLGGSLDTVRADGTFRVRARIPYRGPA
ncbi:MAG: histidine kinase [Chloroflexota bacterium]|nr:histidine kinase [Chloroflexota bacterium]